jgi:hypothetical protein
LTLGCPQGPVVSIENSQPSFVLERYLNRLHYFFSSLFDDPGREERGMYAKYWQQKLDGNKDVFFPDCLVDEVADSTEGFSFAYLKEALYVALPNLTLPTTDNLPFFSVSTLVTLAGISKDKPSFSTTLKVQIKALRKQLEKTTESTITSRGPHSSLPPPHNDDNGCRDVRVLLDALSDSIVKTPNLFGTSSNSHSHSSQNLPRHSNSDGNRDIRVLLDALSDAIDMDRFSPSRLFVNRGQSHPQQPHDPRDFKALLDGLSNNRYDGDTLSGRLFSSHTPNHVPPIGQDYMSQKGRDDTDRLNPFLPQVSGMEGRQAINEAQPEGFNPFTSSSSGLERSLKWPSPEGH